MFDACQLALNLGERTRKPSALVVKARRAVRPLLRAIQRGKIRVPEMTCMGNWAGSKAGNKVEAQAVGAFMALLKRVCNGELCAAGIEKAGVVLTPDIVFKLGKRAELEPEVYASAPPESQRLLTPSALLLPGVAVAERVTPLDHLSPSARVEALTRYGNKWRRKAIRALTVDDHFGNVGVDSNGKLVLLDYSYGKKHD